MPTSKQVVWFIVIALAAAVVGGIVVRRFTEPTVVHVVKVQEDSARVQALAADYQHILKERNTLIETVFRLKTAAKPTGGAVANPDPSPVKPETLIVVQPYTLPGDTSAKPVVYPVYRQDMIVAGWIERDAVKFLTINPYYQAHGLPYAKTYEFDRSATDLQFAADRSQDAYSLDGIRMQYLSRPYQWGGLWVSMDAEYPEAYGATLEARFLFYEAVAIAPYIHSEPAVGVSLQVRIQ